MERVMPLLIVLAMLSVSQQAAAEDKAKASALNKKAIQSYKSKSYLKAIDLWLQATEFATDDQLIKLHKNLGLALKKLERPAEAWYHLTVYMQRSSKTDGKVARQVQELEKELKKIHTKVNISSQPAGALAILPPGDRMHKLRTPFSWWLPPGEFRVEFQKEGYADAKEVLRVEYGGKEQFDFALKRKATTGTLKLTGNPDGSSVRLNGKAQGPLPYHVDLKPGSYDLAVYYADGRVWKSKAKVTAGQTTEMEVNIGIVTSPTPRGKKEAGSDAWKWATLAGGAVLAGVGVALHATGISNNNTRYDEVLDKWQGKGLTATTPTTDEAYIGYVTEFDSVFDEDVKPYLTGAYVLYGVGGAAILTGAIALMLPPGDQPSDSSHFQLLPALSPGQAGLDFQVTF
jgi:hypothetical protein